MMGTVITMAEDAWVVKNCIAFYKKSSSCNRCPSSFLHTIKFHIAPYITENDALDISMRSEDNDCPHGFIHKH